MNEFFSGLSNQHFVGELSLGVVFFRLFLAVVFGGLVGFERERKRKPAGFRTYYTCVLWGGYCLYDSGSVAHPYH